MCFRVSFGFTEPLGILYSFVRRSFGLLHRIPPQNPDYLPGSTPPELAEDEYHEEQLFVPADVHANSRVMEWRHHEQWNGENSETLSDLSGQDTAVPGHEAADHYTIREEDEDDYVSPPAVTPRRSSPLARVSSAGFRRGNTASSLGSSPLLNGD